MDIRRLKPEAEIICEIEKEGDPLTLTFKMGFIPIDEIPNYIYDFNLPTLPAKPKGRIPGRNETAAPEALAAPAKRPRISDIIRRAVMDAIHAWDLTDGDVPIPCTQENKEKHLPLLFGFQVKQPKQGPEIEGSGNDEELPTTKAIDRVLVMVLADFAGRPENFLKN